jgi:hypothetical protein
MVRDVAEGCGRCGPGARDVSVLTSDGGLAEAQYTAFVSNRNGSAPTAA